MMGGLVVALAGVSVAEWVYRALAVLFALSAHEYAHAYVAYLLGDKAQRYLGRLTLNPLAHLDPVGTLMLLVARVGWAKPVRVNPLAFKNHKQGMVLTALAGPGCNILLAFLFVLPFRLGFAGMLGEQMQAFLVTNVFMNVGLAAFNLIPIPPLDGSKVLWGFLPRRQAYAFDKLEAYGPLLLVFLVMTGISNVVLVSLFNFLLRIIA